MSKTLNSKLKKCDPDIQKHVKDLKFEITAFKKEITKLQKQKASLKAKNFSANKWIKALEIEIKKTSKTVNYRMSWGQPKPPAHR
jgi:peptidoglycan hydrolase CwlO-like protein